MCMKHLIVLSAVARSAHAKSHYAGLNELCSKSAHRIDKHDSIDIYRRPQCLHIGSYHKDANGALNTNATGFYSYDDVAHWEQGARQPESHKDGLQEISDGEHTLSEWSWRLPSPCTLQAASEKFFCETLHAFHEKQLRDHPRQNVPNSSSDYNLNTQSQSSTDVSSLSTTRFLVSRNNQPPIPPGCNLNSGKKCRLQDGSIHPAVRRGGAFSFEKGSCGHAEDRVGPHVVLVGDSIVGGQLQALFGSSAQFGGVVEGEATVEHWHGGHVRTACGVHVSTYRADRLQIIKEGLGPNPCWVAGVCRSDVAVINYGAHASSIERFTNDFKSAVDELESTCGDAIRSGRPKVFFRTTPEGNPWCNTKLIAQENSKDWNMSAWSNFTWGILSGKQPPPDNLFKLSWSWGKFQVYNMIAAKMLAPLGMQMLDVVPMTRLRPTIDWGIRAGKNIDCLHGNPAVNEWNNLFINALAADMCSDEATST